MNSLKLGVEVVNAFHLFSKSSEASSNVFVELHFDKQRFRTTIKERDSSPVWNESFYFNISDPNNLSNLDLEAYVCNLPQGSSSKTVLGRVRLTGTSFVPYSEAVPMNCPLEKGSLFSRARGELGLKVFVTDGPSMNYSNPTPAMVERSLHSDSYTAAQPQGLVEEIQNMAAQKAFGDKAESKARRTFNHLPNQVPQPQQSPYTAPVQHAAQFSSHEMKPKPQAPTVVRAYPGSASQPPDYALKETSPVLGGGQVIGGRVIRPEKPIGTYDLVEQMQFLFVRIVKAQDLPNKDLTGSLDPYVEVRLGNFKGTTSHFQKNKNPEWNQVFAFSRDRVQASRLEILVWDKDLVKDDFVGIVTFDVNDIPTRVPPDSPLAPQWYRLEGKVGETAKGELMVAVWYGTQADEAFSEAWHSDAVVPDDSSSGGSSHIRSKVYHSPRLWYVRVSVIEAQDVTPSDKGRIPSLRVKTQIGNHVQWTRTVQTQTMNPLWNEDFIFVAAEPFDEHLVLSLEDSLGGNKFESIGKVGILLNNAPRRLDNKLIPTQWFNLDKSSSVDLDPNKNEKDREKFFSKLHLRICLEGGYHVFDESTHYSSDLRPTAKQLWKKPIGVLELGILSANGLPPIKTRDGKGTSDTFCVAKYSQKWVRTRTIIGNLNPRYNEQYHWEVYDPATVITVGVFDNGQIGGSSSKDTRIGKVRIRVSTLEAGRVYTHSYPLLVLHPSGVKKMGELHLAIKFSCTSRVDMMFIYSRPLLPKMHYAMPLSVAQIETLRHQAVNVVAARLIRTEPPLRREVVDYMSDVNSHLWSIRKSKAHFFRLMSVVSGLLAAWKWFGEVCVWKNPLTTALVHILFVMLMCFPEMILPTVFLYLFVVGAWNYRFRPRYPPHMDTQLSCAHMTSPDELDEEFDNFPTTRSTEIVRFRYDRVRSMAGKIQSVIGDLATQAERIQALISWRDTRATVMFMVFCLVAATVLYTVPFNVVTLLGGAYVMRHPRFRHKMPPVVINFFRRLPARTDSML
uniref:C2 domain-containing protein n=1 Tax=Kalanchoe fedtschenkoi TaxID=63787 RepID=A0A7N0UXL4_KALFE